MNLGKRNILITGATGYTGKILARHFSESKENEIHLLIRNPDKLDKSLSNKSNCHIALCGEGYSSIGDYFQKNKIDLVIHLAAKSGIGSEDKSIEEYLDCNLRFSSLLLEAMHRSGCKRFINTGSYWQNATSEDYEPTCFYAATKEAFEKIIEFYTKKCGLKALTLKVFDSYGEEDTRDKFLYKLLRSILERLTIPATEGLQKMNFLNIKDVTNAYEIAANILLNDDSQKSYHQKFFLPGKDFLSLKEVAEIVREKSDIKEDLIAWGKIPYRNNQIMKPYIGKALPDYEAKHSLAEFIEKEIEIFYQK